MRRRILFTGGSGVLSTNADGAGLAGAAGRGVAAGGFGVALEAGDSS